MVQLALPPEPFDAVVVGSGATGGWAARKLTLAGMRVALIEAGEKTKPADFAGYDIHPDDAVCGTPCDLGRERAIQASCYACRPPKHPWFVNDLENPYQQAKPFHWIRMRVLGGRLLAWERQSYRMSNLDFKAASHDGYGDNWPFSYEDLVPYYEEVERYLGITGIPEKLAYLPDSIFLPAAANNLTMELLGNAGAKLNRVITPARLAVMTRTYESHQACYSSAPSENGVLSSSHFSSPWMALTDAARTGRLTLITDAIASHIPVAKGKATGIAYVNRISRTSHELRAKIVVLCASTLESTRLLLNSKICNSSGMLGRYLMDHIGGYAWGAAEGRRPEPNDPHQRHRVYIPRFRNTSEKLTNGFIRGYGFQARIIPDAQTRQSFGASATPADCTVRLSSFGECLARRENFVEIDPDRLDAWGIPVLRIRACWSGNEIRIWRDATAEAAQLLETAGLRRIGTAAQPSKPGLSIHETGTARMGDSPRSSVLNQYCQAHDVPNIFVTDGACWVSSGCQNPTLTMMAITGRACTFIIQEYSKTKC
ncbi:MAG: GMC family oxidoreductase [Acidobacteriaceae bacterium]|nr:GMC family oxidoreductase [Acidobacteriaceae bacterium]